MVRKTVFSREDVVNAAVAVVEKDGLDGLRARRVAEELGASTAPVYSNFENMETLAVAVKQSVGDLMLSYTEQPYTADPFLNMGLGILEFARAKPGLYGAVFLQHGSECEAGPRLITRLAERMGSLPGLFEVPAGERILLLHHMAIYTHGLAARICAGLTDPYSFSDLAVLMKDVGDSLVVRARSGQARSPEQQELIRVITAANEKEFPHHDA